MKKVIKWILIVLLVLAIAGIIFVFAPGYQLYKDAINEISLAKKVELVKEDENYIGLDQVPERLSKCCYCCRRSSF